MVFRVIVERVFLFVCVNDADKKSQMYLGADGQKVELYDLRIAADFFVANLRTLPWIYREAATKSAIAQATRFAITFGYSISEENQKEMIDEIMYL